MSASNNRQGLGFSLVLAIALSITYGSCAIVSFDEATVTTNLPANGGIFLGDEIILSFSLPIEPNSAEDVVSLVEGSTAIAADKNWQSGSLRIRPAGGWKKGKSYRLDLSGDVIDTQGRVFKPDYCRAFTYGSTQELLRLTGWTPGQGAIVEGDTVILLHFSKPVSQTAFTDAFTVNPYRELDFSFAPDSRSVEITPKEDWEPLEVYTWYLKNLRAADDYYIDRDYSGIIQTATDLERPVLTEVCPAIRTGTGEYAPLQGESMDGTLEKDQPFALLFSEPMDRESLSDSLTITPSVEGSLIPADATHTIFIFIPDSGYSIETRYRLVIQETAKGQKGLPLGAEFELFFTANLHYITVDSATLNGKIYAPIPGSSAIAEQQILNDTLSISIAFSQALSLEQRIQAISGISLEPIFPSTALIPRLLQVGWSPEGSTVTMVWENFSVDATVKKYYRLNVKIDNMEESACLAFYTVP